MGTTQSLKHRFANKLTAIPVSDIVVVLLGLMAVNEFFAQVFQGYLGPFAFHMEIFTTLPRTHAPQLLKDLLIFIANHAGFFAPFLSACLLLSGCLAILLIARAYVALAISLFYFVVWLSLLRYPGIWTFEYLLPSVIGFCAAMDCFARQKKSFRGHILGTKGFANCAHHTRLLLALGITAVLAYVVWVSDAGGHENWRVVIYTAAASGALLLGSALLEIIRDSHETPIVTSVPWKDIIVVIIGAMLVGQVYADIAVNWFTPKGYGALIQTYVTQTHAPHWFKDFLAWSHENASALYVIQFIFESSAALCLSALILRGPMLLLTSGLLIVLTFAEFGVSARWPAHPGDPKTWTWELLFTATVALVLGLQKFGETLQAPTWNHVLFGDKLFGQWHMGVRMVFAALGALALWGVCIATQIFGPANYVSISNRAGVTFFIALMVSALLDRWRSKTSIASFRRL